MFTYCLQYMLTSIVQVVKAFLKSSFATVPPVGVSSMYCPTSWTAASAPPSTTTPKVGCRGDSNTVTRSNSWLTHTFTANRRHTTLTANQNSKFFKNQKSKFLNESSDSYVDSMHWKKCCFINNKLTFFTHNILNFCLPGPPNTIGPRSTAVAAIMVVMPLICFLFIF